MILEWQREKREREREESLGTRLAIATKEQLVFTLYLILYSFNTFSFNTRFLQPKHSNIKLYRQYEYMHTSLIALGIGVGAAGNTTSTTVVSSGDIPGCKRCEY